ncbi:DNA break repair nuclease [Mortierella sp. GBA43]|nr:DNA break repair nuclease [Mortierella sp. GBA43]
MQEATKGATVIDGLPAGSTALETTLAQFSASNESDDDQVNKDNDYEDDDYPEDEIRDDIDQETYQAPTNDPVAENACPTPDAHVNRCLDGTIDNSSAVHGHGTEERAIHGKSSTPTTNEPTPSTSNKFTSPRFKITNGSSSAKPSTRTQSKQKVARPCPFYKKMPDTNFTVDAFSYGAIDGCDAYFLTHFHSDHYGGLTSTWSHGPIYCSNITANLVISRLGVDTNYVKRLPMDEPTIVQGVTIRLLDANHCPGSVLFVFDLQNPQRRYLHTGDFRAIPDMCLNPILCQPPNTPIDILYLDTTYMNPKYTFPPQDTVVREATHLVCKEMGIQPLEVATPIAAAVVVAPAPVVQVAIKKVNVMMSWLRRESGNTEKLQSMSIKASQSVKMRQTWQEPSEKNKIVICVGTYLIGKERVFKAIAKAIKSKVFVQDSKLQILSCLEDPELMDMLTSDRLEAQVHLLHMGSDMSPQALQEYLDSLGSAFTRLIAIRPTGWTFTGSKKFTPADDGLMNGQTEMATALSPTPTTLELRPSFMSSTIKIYPIPYSEHSSFNELAGFVRSLDIRKVIPTVGVGSEKGRHAMNEWFRRWEEERRQGKGWE